MDKWNGDEEGNQNDHETLAKIEAAMCLSEVLNS